MTSQSDNEDFLTQDCPALSDGVLHNKTDPPAKDELLAELELRLGGTC